MFGFLLRLIVFYFLFKFIFRGIALLGRYLNRVNTQENDNKRNKYSKQNDNFSSSNIIDAEFEDIE